MLFYRYPAFCISMSKAFSDSLPAWRLRPLSGGRHLSGYIESWGFPIFRLVLHLVSFPAFGQPLCPSSFHVSSYPWELCTYPLLPSVRLAAFPVLWQPLPQIVLQHRTNPVRALYVRLQCIVWFPHGTPFRRRYRMRSRAIASPLAQSMHFPCLYQMSNHWS